MASDTISASWHPALMPNSLADIVASHQHTEASPEPQPERTLEMAHPQKPQDTSSHDIPYDSTATKTASSGSFFNQFDAADPDTGGWDISAQEDQDVPPSQHKATREPSSEIVDTTTEQEPGTEATETANGRSFLDQFDAEDPEAGGWDISTQNQDVSPSQHEATIEPSAEAINTVAEQEPVISNNTAKHSSTVSFARTVSQEVNWNDDEDVEWNLQRSETDPFKFMAPNNRTNSFPAVPPIEQADEEQWATPPPATQAQDILHEVEHEEHETDLAAQSDFPGGYEDGNEAEEDHNGDTSFQQSVGGDRMGAEEEASNARFEEGLPLIPQTEAEEDNAQNSKPPGFDDTFADEAGEGDDDFFSQIPGSSRQEVEEADLNHMLQRKDTSMFVDTTTNYAAASNYAALETPTIPEANESQAALPTTEAEEAITGDSTEVPSTAEQIGPIEPDELDAKWAAAFDGDEEDGFLLEDSATESKELDPAAFFGSDDEGFLEDEAEASTSPPVQEIQPTPNVAAQVPNSGVNGRYTPNVLPAQPPPASNSYNHLPPVPQAQHPLYPQYGTSTMAPPAGLGYGAPPIKPDLPKAQSFVDKAKGGYSSPYDLPMDVVRAPKKRISMQQLPRTTTTPSAPPIAPRASSMYSQPPPPSAVPGMYSQPPPPSGPPIGSPSPPTSSHSNPQAPGLKSPPQLKSKASFFEDLPISSKPRPGSRNSLPSPQQNPYNQLPPNGSSQGHPFVPPPMQLPPMVSPPVQQSQLSADSLVAPERASPYAPLQSTSQPKPSAPSSSRYSPVSAQVPPSNGVPPTAAANRYSPAPVNSRSSSGYSPVPPPILAHQPRTSSPLAHFEVSHDRQPNKLASPISGEGAPLPRSGSSQYEARLNRVPSLPPTREVEEEGAQVLMQPPPASRTLSAAPPGESRYSPQQARRTPPPMGPPAASTLSPPKRSTSNYAPAPHLAGSAKEVNFAPPPRSQTQSPGALYGNKTAAKTIDPVQRPSSVQGASAPRPVSNALTSPTKTRTRGMSQALALVPPTDGRENDPLQRWMGAPLVSWGVGGTLVLSYPKDVPRYGMNQTLPMIIRSPGEVKVNHVKDVLPLEERLAKFPGPLKGKSKKKETIPWLTQGIDVLEASLPKGAYQQTLTHEDKRAIERVLLWKILRVFIEFDGVLEGNANVEKAVRQILSPGIDGDSDEPASALSTGSNLHAVPSAVTGMQSDAVDSSAVEQIRKHLLMGDREKAAWAAVDKRLWGHAMLIANTVQGDLYKQVTQEFIKKEVNHAGHSNESIAALYGVLSGSFEESVDELVPSHARAGLQLMSTSASSSQSTDTLAGLDKWRETLGLILSNRSNADIIAITSLGKLLSGYGRAEAAHICFLFARQHAVFGGLDNPQSNFVLVGADHQRQADQFGKETEALLLSEVYEYGLSLAGGSNVPQSCPHLARYKLQHAITLAEYGFRDKALLYCEAIMNAIMAQTKRSTYYTPGLETSVDDLIKRLRLAPKEESSSWIPKPTMNQVSSTVWNRFNKFVSGEDNENAGPGSPGEPGTEQGPFARIAGGTPTISRSPSVNNFEMYANTGPSPAVPVSGGTKAASRYAPVTGQPSASPYDPGSTYAARTSMERSSGEYQRTSHDLPRPVADPTPMYGASFDSNSAPTFGYQPVSSAAPSASQYTPGPQDSAPISIPQPSSTGYSPYQPYGAQPPGVTVTESKTEPSVSNAPADLGYQPPSYGYEPPSMNSFEAPAAEPEEPAASGGYEAPSYQPYSFEAPSYEPGPEENESSTDKPKKKSFMDDDEDDFHPPPKPKDKAKSEKDRENEELFRKAAEEDAKRAEAAKSGKKGGWFGGGWFGGGKKEGEMPAANKPIRAKLGESSSFIYDPDQKRWVNKKAGADITPPKTSTPPPPRAMSNSGTPPPGAGSSSTPPPFGAPPPMGIPRSVSNLNRMASSDNLAPPGSALGGPTAMSRSFSNMSNASDSGSGPPSNVPSRPATSLSNASSIDDLIGAAGPRKAGAKKARKSGRYVDVMAK